jgi:hypothetical protein
VCFAWLVISVHLARALKLVSTRIVQQQCHSSRDDGERNAERDCERASFR